MMRAAAGCLLAILPWFGMAQAQSAFDGTWDVSVTCPDAGNARGYTLRFPVVVQNGILAGTYQRGTAFSGTLHLTGPINPDGTARLEASGVIGDPQHAGGRANAGTPYRYTVAARFAGTSGTGRRLETRPCEFSFAKR